MIERQSEKRPTDTGVERAMPTADALRVASDARWVRLGAALVAVGAAARVAEYARNDPCFIDESKLGLALFGRSLGDLLRPLAFEQVAPVGYRLAVAAVAAVFGPSELALRALSLVASVAGLLALRKLAVEVLTPRAAAAAVGFAALNPVLIQYAAMVKPYALDACVAPVWLLLASRFFSRGAFERPARTAFVVAAGTVVLLFSIPSLFVVGASWAVIGIVAHRVRSPGAVRVMAGAAVVWGAAAMVSVHANALSPEVSRAMDSIWRYGFLSGPIWLSNAVGMLQQTFAKLTIGQAREGPEAWTATLVAAVLLVCGSVRLARQDRRRTALLLGPVLLVLGASVVRAYPIAPRTCLFLAPILTIVAAAGLDSVAGRFKGVWSAVVFLALAAGCSFGQLTHFALRLRVERDPGERALVAEVDRAAARGDAVYIPARSVPTWSIYAIDWRSDPESQLRWLALEIGAGAAYENELPRNSAVGNREGEALWYGWKGRVVVLGLPVGRQWPALAPAPEGPGDPGLVEREVQRLTATHSGCVWLFSSHDPENVAGLIGRELSLRGWSADRIERRAGSGLAHLCRSVGAGARNSVEPRE